MDFIVMGVYRYYEKKVRHKIPEHVTDCGDIVSKPEWTREVIVKHLMWVHAQKQMVGRVRILMLCAASQV